MTTLDIEKSSARAEMQISATRRSRRRRIILVAAIIGFFLLYQTLYSGLHHRQSWHEAAAASNRYRGGGGGGVMLNSNNKEKFEDWPGHKFDEIPHADCPPLPGMENMVVVMRTGVTEAQEKVPIHFNTTLRCVPNYLIFSDFEEDINDVHIYDALRDVDADVKEQVEEFQLYNRLRAQGRKGLKANDYRDETNTVFGKPNNPGWKLDKWKFLPMAHQTLRHNESAHWYFFMEADTYPFWSNLLAWTAHFDPQQPHYIGTETQIGDVIFAHGGAGFLVSNPALRRAVDTYLTDPVGVNTLTDYHWAGDCVLGKVLADQGVSLRYSWPLLQNSQLGELDEFTQVYYRRPWCFPIIALHHLSRSDIHNLWVYEQQKLASTNNSTPLHSDIFRDIIYPSLSPEPRDNWDNLSPELRASSVRSVQDCHGLCRQHPECVQYSFHKRNKKCFTSKTPKMGVKGIKGKRGDSVTSGWIIDRVEEMVRQAGSCRKVEYGL